MVTSQGPSTFQSQSQVTKIPKKLFQNLKFNQINLNHCKSSNGSLKDN